MVTVALSVAQTAGWDHMNGWGGGWMWLWVFVMVMLFVLLVGLIRAGVGGSSATPRDPAQGAREILAERYAKGELSTEEYRERVSELP